MDIGWYKDNIALQAELRREYPAVAGLIDRLKAELEEALALVLLTCREWRKDLHKKWRGEG